MSEFHPSNHYKPCMMTVSIHDYAYPKEREYPWPLFPSFYTEKPRPPQSVVLFDHMTLDTLRNLSNEDIGRFVKEMLLKVDNAKRQIEV